MRHLWIPDTQVRDGVPLDHIKALGNYIEAKQFEKIIIAGDWWDFPSVSHFNSKQEQEKMRIFDDIDSGNRAMSMLWKPMQDANKKRAGWKMRQYKPVVHFLHGNHEFRLERFIAEHPELERLLGYHLMNVDRFGMVIHPFREILRLDGIDYCHYFYMPKTGRPYSGMIETRLKNIGHSFTQGHDQEFAYGERQLPNGEIHHGLVAGAFYMHDETYKGPQGNAHWRGVVVKNEVHDGRYDIMKISLDYLLRKYG
jgi:hypothetical protein